MSPTFLTVSTPMISARFCSAWGFLAPDWKAMDWALTCGSNALAQHADGSIARVVAAKVVSGNLYMSAKYLGDFRREQSHICVARV